MSYIEGIVLVGHLYVLNCLYSGLALYDYPKRGVCLNDLDYIGSLNTHFRDPGT